MKYKYFIHYDAYIDKADEDNRIALKGNKVVFLDNPIRFMEEIKKIEKEIADDIILKINYITKICVIIDNFIELKGE